MVLVWKTGLQQKENEQEIDFIVNQQHVHLTREKKSVLMEKPFNGN